MVTFKLFNKIIGINATRGCKFEFTQINKIISKKDGSSVGVINYKGTNISVYDISKKYFNKTLKKFDGLLFIFPKNKPPIAIKTEGFFKEQDSADIIIDIDEII